jgi:hypothetical protein
LQWNACATNSDPSDSHGYPPTIAGDGAASDAYPAANADLIANPNPDPDGHTDTNADTTAIGNLYTVANAYLDTAYSAVAKPDQPVIVI